MFPEQTSERGEIASEKGLLDPKPPWDDVLDPDEIELLWAYVIRGEPAD